MASGSLAQNAVFVGWLINHDQLAQAIKYSSRAQHSLFSYLEKLKQMPRFRGNEYRDAPLPNTTSQRSFFKKHYCVVLRHQLLHRKPFGGQ